MQIKFNFWTMLIIVIVLLIFVQMCRNCTYIPNRNTNDTVSVKFDTIYLQSKVDTEYIPKVQKVITYVPTYQTVTNNVVTLIPKDVDTANILKDYFSTKIYSDTQVVKYGNLVINDTVSQNKIQKRRLILNQNIPQSEKVVTLTQPKRNVLYLSLTGQIIQPIGGFAIGGGAMFKSKNDHAIELQYLIDTRNNTYYQLSYKLPIRLSKR